MKANYWKDLITDEPFTRKDIIEIQDPTDLQKFNFANFYHIKKNLKLLDEGKCSLEHSAILEKLLYFRLNYMVV